MPDSKEVASPESAAAALGLELREYRPGDEHAILATFNRVFAAVDPTFVPRRIEWWRWQYLENPGGWRIIVAVTPDGAVVSQYSGVGQKVLLDGQAASFGQAIDSMSDPSYRRGLKKPGVFVLTGHAWERRYLGSPDLVIWGLPVPVAWRIGKTHLGYQVIRTQSKLTCDSRTWTRAAAPGVDVEVASALPDDLDDLFARAAAPYRAIGVRDAAYLSWRFLTQPGKSYELALARRGGRLVGLAFFRAGYYADEHGGLACEWLVDPADDGVRAALVAWLRERTEASGHERLFTAVPDTSPEWLALQRLGFRVEPSRYFVVGRSAFPSKHDMRWLYHNWYYTLGDSDLV